MLFSTKHIVEEFYKLKREIILQFLTKSKISSESNIHTLQKGVISATCSYFMCVLRDHGHLWSFYTIQLAFNLSHRTRTRIVGCS